MKKNKIIIPIISVLALVVVAIIIGKATASDVDTKMNQEAPYTMKYAYDDHEDGWTIGFKIYYHPNDRITYSFNGYNMKYEELDGYYVPMIDSTTGEVVEKLKPDVIRLSTSEKLSGEINDINEYFNEKKFKESIILSDLDELKTNKIDKEYLVELFNKTINSEELTSKGNYADSSLFDRVEVESTTTDLEGTWKLSYTVDYGNITNIYIDLVSKDGKYLKSTKKQNKIQQSTIESIKVFEDELVKKLNQNDIKKEVEKSNYSKVSKNYVESINTNLPENDMENLVQEMIKSLNS